MAEPLTLLPPSLLEFLQVPRLVQLTTVAPGGGPFVNTLSWVLAAAPDRVRLVGHGRTRFIQNLRQDPRVALTVLGAGSAWTIYGQARLLTDEAPVGAHLFTLVEAVDLQVHPVLFLGAVLTREPEWDVTGDHAEAERLDREAFAVMRGWGASGA